ncbi:MAG: AsmA-like C-terminal region-containing protein, partial [Planctomycetota bacterium]
ASLNRVSVDRLTLDRETLAGLPSAWSTGLARLNWSGPIQATGSVNLAASAKAGQPISASWDLNLDVENGSLKMGVPVEQIRGEVHLIGQSNAQSVTSQGELRIDSALCQGIQITQLRGPFRLTPQRLIFGDQWADRGRAELPPRPITAQLFGGRVAGDAVVTLADESLVRVQADIQNVDLGELSREFAPKGRDVVGRAFAAVKFEGTSRGLNTWRGGGKVTCRDADFFEVPVMAAMVKTARGLPADQAAAFQLSDVDFRFDGERVYFDRIDFKGDAVTLRGAGEMSLNRHVDLQFYTLMARDELKIPVLGPMLNEASRQIMEVRVTGPLEEPTVDKKVVPVINEALQKMFPELTGRTGERKPWSSRVPGPAQLLPFGAPR